MEGGFKICRQLGIYSFYQVKGQQKRLNCCFKCIFLVEYLFYYSLNETDKKLTFSPLLHQVFVGWSTLINISGTKLDLVFHFARFLREEPQMVHFAMDSVCGSPISPSRYIYY